MTRPYSLRTRIFLLTAITMAIVQGVFAFSLYAKMRSNLFSEFDWRLITDVSSLAATVDFDHGRPTLDHDAALPFSDAYYEIRSPGAPPLRSSNLNNTDLPVLPVTANIATPIILPNNDTGRVLSLTRPAPLEHGEHDKPGPNITVTIARDDTLLRHTLSTLATLLLSLCLASIAVSSALLALLIALTLGVTNRLAGELSTLNAADLSRRINLPDAPREFQPVIATVNDLLARLAEAFDRERAFSSDVAHELRTPLASLQTTLDVALRRQPNDPANRTSLERCHPVVRQMRSIVENLLTIARADSGQLPFAPEPVDLSALLHEAWQPFADPAAAKNLSMNWNLTTAAPLHTDPHHLRLILRNLLDNAVTYTPPGGTITIATTSTAAHTAITLENTGCALTPADLPHLFDRFWRADAARSNTESHAGLGLSLCRRLATTLGGALTAQCDHAHFSITCRLPAPAPRPANTRSDLNTAR